MHVLAVDLTGPHPMAIGTKYTYARVAVYYTGIGGSLPCVQGLASKNGTEVMNAIVRVIREILWTCGNVLVLRIHSDARGEFGNEVSKEVISRLGIMQTRTEGYDPQATGGA